MGHRCALVGAGLGVALAPRLARLPAGYPVVRVPLRGDPSPARHILTATRRGRREHPLVAQALRVLDDAARRQVAAEVDLRQDSGGGDRPQELVDELLLLRVRRGGELQAVTVDGDLQTAPR